jgi:hypothetical protein
MRPLKPCRFSVGADSAYRASAQAVASLTQLGSQKALSLTPNLASAFGHGPIDGLGAMSIGYGGQGQSLTYQTTATFQGITHPANADFLIGFESQSSLGTGFDSAGDVPGFVEVGEAGIAVEHAMRRQRRVQLVG